MELHAIGAIRGWEIDDYAKLSQTKKMKKIIILIFVLLQVTIYSQSKEVAVTVLQPQEFFINGAINITGQTTLVLDVNLPENTTKWYYTFAASRSKEQIKQTNAQFALFTQLTKIIDNTGTTAKALTLLNTPPGNDYSNVYLLASRKDADNFNKEFTLKGFKYIGEGSRQNYVSGIVEVTNTSNLQGRQYLGIQNPSTTYGITVIVEVVAIVKEEEIVNGWKKSQKEGLFSYLNHGLKEKHKHHLSDDLISDFTNCMANKITSNYTAIQLENVAKYEANSIIDNIHNKCEQELNLAAKYSLKDNVATEERLIGTWSDENSVFEFKENGVFTLKFDNQNSIIQGKWKLSSERLTFNINGSEDNYIIKEYSENKIRYKYIKSGEIFNAERISREGYNMGIASAASTNGSANFTDLVGKWKADNCTYTLSNDGSILISWFSGGTTNGVWRFENSQLKVKYAKTDTWSIYEFKKFSKTEMEYQHTQTKEVFKATKIK
jgi:hypothetical protein